MNVDVRIPHIFHARCSRPGVVVPKQSVRRTDSIFLRTHTLQRCLTPRPPSRKETRTVCGAKGYEAIDHNGFVCPTPQVPKNVSWLGAQAKARPIQRESSPPALRYSEGACCRPVLETANDKDAGTCYQEQPQHNNPPHEHIPKKQSHTEPDHSQCDNHSAGCSRDRTDGVRRTPVNPAFTELHHPHPRSAAAHIRTRRWKPNVGQ